MILKIWKTVHTQANIINENEQKKEDFSMWRIYKFVYANEKWFYTALHFDYFVWCTHKWLGDLVFVAKATSVSIKMHAVMSQK